MDDSWRMLIGMTNERKHKHNIPRRRSTEDRLTSLGPEDFKDVFGGPPRTVLARQFSATSSQNEEFFWPQKSEGFHNDVFTKSNSSSVLSSDELSNGDSSFLAFSSKLRPINIPNRWSSSVMLNEEQQWQQGPEFPTHNSSNLDSLFTEINFVDNFKSFHKKVSERCSSQEQETLESTLYDDLVDDQELNVEDGFIQEYGNDDEVMSSYVIDLGRDDREKIDEEAGVDEAIAWVKGQFSSEKKCSNCVNNYGEKQGFSGRHMYEDGTSRFLMDKDHNEMDYEKLMKIDMKMEQLDNDIIKWASDKEANICLLLSTLHQILWPNSGWSPVPLKNLQDNGQVRKAYRKARLCLHPDKLQQRGATAIQKHIASKVFSILQEAWATYIS